MYAIIQDRGRQYKVEEGQSLQMDLMQKEAGAEVTFDQVLLVNDGKEIHVGAPYIKKATVKAQVERNYKGKKVIVFMFRRRKGYKKKRGHRQQFSQIKVLSISK